MVRSQLTLHPLQQATLEVQSLKTRAEATRLLAALSEAGKQPAMNLGSCTRSIQLLGDTHTISPSIPPLLNTALDSSLLSLLR